MLDIVKEILPMEKSWHVRHVGTQKKEGADSHKPPGNKALIPTSSSIQPSQTTCTHMYTYTHTV